MSRIYGSARMEWIGLGCAAGAVGFGLLYLTAAGAPARYILLNAAALAVGFAGYFTIVRPRWRLGRAGEAIQPALGLLLLATALFGMTIEGAARWASLGPITIQVSLIVLPVMICLFARNAKASGSIGLSIAALALALQPDRAMAAALFAALLVLAMRRREPAAMVALAAAAAGLAAAMAQADRLPAVPFVDGIFYSAFDVHPAAGAAVLMGAVLLIVPALFGSRVPAMRDGFVVFGIFWLTVVLAAALGNYPTPLVGYGGSAIVGYLLSLAVAVGRLVPERQSPEHSRRGENNVEGPSLSVGLV